MAVPKPGSDNTSGAQQNTPSNRIKEPWERQPCGLCRAAKSAKRCNGHGGGGGGGGGSGNSAEESDKKVDLVYEAKASASAVGQIFKFAMVMNKDKKAGLTFKLECGPYHLLSKEQKNQLKLIDLVLKELEAFKKEHKIDADCIAITKDKNGNILSLSIILPTAALNAEFVQRLANKNLLQSQHLAQTKEKTASQESRYFLNLTPLATKFASSLKQNKADKEIEKPHASKEQKKPSRIRPSGPRDKLKPKGWQ